MDSIIERVIASAVLHPRLQSAANKENATGVHVFKNNLKLGELWNTTPDVLVTASGVSEEADRNRLV